MRLVFCFAIFLSACTARPSYSDGEELYKKHCAGCHIDDGTGVGALVPPLAQSDYLQRIDLKVACLIRNGVQGKMLVNGQEYEGIMPANARLSDIEITNIANYIFNAWGNERDFIAPEEIRKTLSECPPAAAPATSADTSTSRN